MRRKSKDINIFSMSALDLFASAMGAFVLITVILMPYYLKKSPEVTPPASSKVVDKLLLIEMKWASNTDVDLHVHTPDGLYNYNTVTIEGSQAQFLQDNTDGGSSKNPAKEYWMSFAPTRGEYKVCYKLHKGIATTVFGKLSKPSGPYEIPNVELKVEKEIQCPVRFSVSSDFQVNIL